MQSSANDSKSEAPVLVTGATGGLGRKVAQRLAAAGRPLVLGGRRREAVEALALELSTQHGVEADVFVADLADLDTVQEALDALGSVDLHGIVANAGITTAATEPSAQGYEITFAVNVLSHQKIFLRLAEQLQPGGRVVVVSSGVHEPENQLARRAGVPEPRWVGAGSLLRPLDGPEDLRLEDGRQRYSTSKLANVLQARGLQRFLNDRSVDVFAIDPGLMVDTDLARELPSPVKFVFRGLGRLVTPFVDNMRSSVTSASHIASLIEDECWAGAGFRYLDGDRVKSPSEDARNDTFLEDLWLSCAEALEIDGAVLPGA
ncbi:MAG: SDR family NAD(P)-dependent oxidoreductase [Acidobacteriota bacterium]